MLLFLIAIVDISPFWLAAPNGDTLAYRLHQMDLTTSTIPGVLQGMLGEWGPDATTQISQLGVGELVEVLLGPLHEALADQRHWLDPKAFRVLAQLVAIEGEIIGEHVAPLQGDAEVRPDLGEGGRVFHLFGPNRREGGDLLRDEVARLDGLCVQRAPVLAEQYHPD